jgi:acetolactate synthase-1/2/3 large subunit
MAHGAYAMTGRAQAVMVHVNVGTGNTINNLINLSRDRVPLILAAGRTPVTEKGSFGSRSRQIHWGQEMFDQAGMVREIVKWDYELRMPGQVADVVARAHEIDMTRRAGRSIWCCRASRCRRRSREPAIAPRPRRGAAHPDPAAIAQLAAGSRRPSGR